MENLQLNSQILEFELSPSDTRFNELPRVDLDSDQLILNILAQNLPPFVVCANFQISRETHKPLNQCQSLQTKILAYNRKEKSLSELSRKFLDKFEGAASKDVALDQVTKELNVQRRRIYDIINIMESLGVVSKIRKNIYEWKGLERAIVTIQSLKEGSYIPLDSRHKKGKSLESLAGQFLKLFITHKKILSLEEATDLILTEANDNVKRTKIRRLYDIINVFKCLGLVKKVAMETGKNGFEFLGDEGLRKFINQKSTNSPVSRGGIDDTCSADEYFSSNMDLQSNQSSKSDKLCELKLQNNKTASFRSSSCKQKIGERQIKKNRGPSSLEEKEVFIHKSIREYPSYLSSLIVDLGRKGPVTFDSLHEQIRKNLWSSFR